MTNIYCLKLENNKYYIGKTNNTSIRIDQHYSGDGSSWTKKYKPLEVLFVKENQSPFDEDKYTKEYMMLYGIDNVRGGSYVTDYLNEQQKSLLKKEIWASMNLCNRCGRKGHFMSNCKQKKDVDGCIIDMPQLKLLKTDKNVCKRCGRNSHTKENCYALTKIDGKKIQIKTCKKCGQKGHTQNKCTVKI